MARTYQFFYIGEPFAPGIIKWKLDSETTHLDEDMLNSRQKAEVEALWNKVDTIGNPTLVYDKVRNFDTGEEIDNAQ